MTVLGLRAPTQFPGRTKMLTLLANTVRDAEDKEIKEKWGLDRDELADYFKSTTDAQRLLEILEDTIDDPTARIAGPGLLGGLIGSSFGPIGIGVGALAGAGLGATLKDKIGPLRSKLSAFPEDRKLSKLMSTVALNPFETARDVAQAALSAIGFGTMDPDAKVNVISGALAPQVSIPIEALTKTSLFTGQPFETVFKGRPVKVGQIIEMPDGRRVRVGGFLDVAISRGVETIPQLRTLLQMSSPYRISGKKILGKRDFIGMIQDVLNGVDTTAARLATEDEFGNKIPQSEILSALRLFGANIKEVDVEARRRARQKFTRQEISKWFNTTLKNNPQTAIQLAIGGVPIAKEWVIRQIRGKARTAQEKIRARMFIRFLETTEPNPEFKPTFEPPAQPLVQP